LKVSEENLLQVLAAMAAVAVDMEIPRNDNRLSLPGVVAVAENLALLPSPRYPSMPRFAATRHSHSDIDATEIRSATFKVSLEMAKIFLFPVCGSLAVPIFSILVLI
jgi:electron transfer flavoprotein alpha/beta subunit